MATWLGGGLLRLSLLLEPGDFRLPHAHRPPDAQGAQPTRCDESPHCQRSHAPPAGQLDNVQQSFGVWNHLEASIHTARPECKVNMP